MMTHYYTIMPQYSTVWYGMVGNIPHPHNKSRRVKRYWSHADATPCLLGREKTGHLGITDTVVLLNKQTSV